MNAVCPRCKTTLEVEVGPNVCGVCSLEFNVVADDLPTVAKDWAESILGTKPPTPPPLTTEDPDVLLNLSGIRVTKSFLQCSGTSYAVSKMAAVTVTMPVPSNEREVALLLMIVAFAVALLFKYWIFAGLVLVALLLAFRFIPRNVPQPRVQWINTAGQSESIVCQNLPVARLVEEALLRAIASSK